MPLHWPNTQKGWKRFCSITENIVEGEDDDIYLHFKITIFIRINHKLKQKTISRFAELVCMAAQFGQKLTHFRTVLIHSQI